MPNEAQPVAAQAPAATAPVTTEAAPAAVETDVAVQNGRTVGEKPSPFRAKSVGNAMERARAALEARSAAAKAAEPKAKETPKASDPAKSGEAPKTNQQAVAQAIAEAGKTEPKADAKPADEPKKEAPKVEPKAEDKPGKLARGLAIIAEREAKVRASEQNVKRMIADFEAKQAAAQNDPQAKMFKQIQEAMASGNKGAVLKALGIDLRAGVEALAGEYQEPTQEEIARKAAIEEFEKRQKELADREARTKAEAEEKEKARVAATRAEYEEGVKLEFSRASDDFPFIIHHEVSAQDVVNYAARLEHETGKRPTHIEALRGLEGKLREIANAANEKLSAKEKAKEEAEKAAAPPPVAVPKVEAKPEPKIEQTKEPVEPRSRKESEFKPRPMRVSKNATAIERARAAMSNRHLS